MPIGPSMIPRCVSTFQSKPATAYSSSLDASTPDKYGAPLGGAARIRFTTGDLSPYAALYRRDGWAPSMPIPTRWSMPPYRNVSRLELSLYR